jgi:hypothetical protein
MNNGLVTCGVHSIAGFSLCEIQLPCTSQVTDMRRSIAVEAWLPLQGWSLLLGPDLLDDPVSMPLKSIGETASLTIVMQCPRHIESAHAIRESMQRLQHSDSNIRRRAIVELAISPDLEKKEIAEHVAPPLSKLLADCDAGVCLTAVQLLGRMGSAAKPFEPEVRMLFEKMTRVVMQNTCYDDLEDLPEDEADTNDSCSPFSIRNAAYDSLERMKKIA